MRSIWVWVTTEKAIAVQTSCDVDMLGTPLFWTDINKWEIDKGGVVLAGLYGGEMPNLPTPLAAISGNVFRSVQKVTDAHDESVIRKCRDHQIYYVFGDFNHEHCKDTYALQWAEVTYYLNRQDEAKKVFAKMRELLSF